MAKKPEDRFASAADFRQALLRAAATKVDARRPDDSLTQAIVQARENQPSQGSSSRPPRPSHSGLHSGGTLLTATSVAGWDASALAPIELALATVLGPMA